MDNNFDVNEVFLIKGKTFDNLQKAMGLGHSVYVNWQNRTITVIGDKERLYNLRQRTGVDEEMSYDFVMEGKKKKKGSG